MFEKGGGCGPRWKLSVLAKLGGRQGVEVMDLEAGCLTVLGKRKDLRVLLPETVICCQVWVPMEML